MAKAINTRDVDRPPSISASALISSIALMNKLYPCTSGMLDALSDSYISFH